MKRLLSALALLLCASASAATDASAVLGAMRSNALLGVVAGVIIILIPQVVRFLLG